MNTTVFVSVLIGVPLASGIGLFLLMKKIEKEVGKYDDEV